MNLVLSTREGAMSTLDFKIVGIFRSLSKEYDARAVRIPLPAAQELTATSGVNAVVVLLADTDSTARARGDLEARLPPGYEIKTWQELADFYSSTAALYERQFGVLQGIILVMVLLSVANNVNMTLHERTPEFRIMRALGRTGGDVFRLAVFETALLGAIGAAPGIGVGAALAALISNDRDSDATATQLRERLHCCDPDRAHDPRRCLRSGHSRFYRCRAIASAASRANRCR